MQKEKKNVAEAEKDEKKAEEAVNSDWKKSESLVLKDVEVNALKTVDREAIIQKAIENAKKSAMAQAEKDPKNSMMMSTKEQ